MLFRGSSAHRPTGCGKESDDINVIAVPHLVTALRHTAYLRQRRSEETRPIVTLEYAGDLGGDIASQLQVDLSVHQRRPVASQAFRREL